MILVAQAKARVVEELEGIDGVDESLLEGAVDQL